MAVIPGKSQAAGMVSRALNGMKDELAEAATGALRRAEGAIDNLVNVLTDKGGAKVVKEGGEEAGDKLAKLEPPKSPSAPELAPSVPPRSSPEALTKSQARQLGGDNRGLIHLQENLGEPRNAAMRAARDFESGTAGAFSDVASKQRAVPALRYDNPVKGGEDFIKFDGIEGDTLLIDAKTRLLEIPTRRGPLVPQVEDLRRMSEAIRQNSGFQAVIEFPDEAARRHGQGVLDNLNIQNIATRVRE